MTPEATQDTTTGIAAIRERLPHMRATELAAWIGRRLDEADAELAAAKKRIRQLEDARSRRIADKGSPRDDEDYRWGIAP